MAADPSDLTASAARLDRILERLAKLEVQVYSLMQSQTVEAQAFVLQDERRQIRTRLDLRDCAPRLTFYDRVGHERLRVGLQPDGTPDLRDFRM
jgi:hypothetical protein